jgi:hypothetical protein
MDMNRKTDSYLNMSRNFHLYLYMYIKIIIDIRRYGGRGKGRQRETGKQRGCRGGEGARGDNEGERGETEGGKEEIWRGLDGPAYTVESAQGNLTLRNIKVNRYLYWFNIGLEKGPLSEQHPWLVLHVIGHPIDDRMSELASQNRTTRT